MPLSLHSTSTMEIDTKIQECATLIKDGALLPKLSAGDMVDIEAKYRAKCLTTLYNQAKREVGQIEGNLS